MIRGTGQFVKPSMEQMEKFHEMVGVGQMHHDLFQFFLEDPWRVLDAVWFNSLRPCDIPTFSGALITSNLALADGLREEDFPWKPEETDERGEKLERLRVQNVPGHWTVLEIEARLRGMNLLPGTLSDLLRLARWDSVFSWEIPVVALGTPISKEEFGLYYPLLRGRTLNIGAAREDFWREPKIFYLGRLKTG